MRFLSKIRRAMPVATCAALVVSSLSLSPASAAPRVHKYVALGDSYASAAGQGPFVDVGPCNRSAHNYPAVVADGLGASRDDDSYVDVSCSGASTTDVLNTQLDAVTSDTDLVTLTAGGDDGGLFLDAVLVCNALGLTDALGIGTPCADHGGEQRPVLSAQGMQDDLDAVRASLVQIFQAIHQRAPKAKILMVNYPRIFTSGVKCGELGAVTGGDSAWLDTIERRLNAQLASAAAQGGAQLVDVYSQSLGNGICAGSQAWIAGILPAPGQALPYHPLPAGSEGVGRIVLESVGKTS
ncbi:MAG: SGNH/GDSL hydrolase family protein [Segniliparus sp.]|uniref:SGNH/GDSL hydrolase family protein n=1 Tax=Segniliparus sp. TaxID=2804064 RepID=UPI003F31BBBA